MTASTAVAETARAETALKWRLLALGQRWGIWIVLLALVIAARALSPIFLNTPNLLNILAQASVVGIAAVGVTFVMVTGGMDVSIAGVITLSAFLAAGVMNGQDGNIVLAVVLTVAAGVAVGLVNGLLIAFFRVDSFILTLAMGSVLLGGAQIYTGGTAFGDPAPGYTTALTARPWTIPVLALAFAAVVLVGLALQNVTRFGRRLYMVGANPRAAYLSGIGVRRTIVLAYVCSGVAAALAGLALVGRAGVPSDFTGMGLEFQVLAAVVLGGTTFEGGRGGVGGTVAGVLVLAVAFTLVTILGLPYAVQLLVRGGIIVVAGALYVLVRRREG